MPQTDRGIVYPDSAGHTRLWEHLGTLAETADAAMDTEAARIDAAVAAARPQPVALAFNGNWPIAPREVGSFDTVRAGMLTGTVVCSAWTSDPGTGIVIRFLLDGGILADVGIPAALTANVHVTLVPNAFHFPNLPAGHHVVTAQTLAGSSDQNDRGCLYANLIPL